MKDRNCGLEERLSGSCLMKMSRFLSVLVVIWGRPRSNLPSQLKYLELRGYSKLNPEDVVQVCLKVYLVHQIYSVVDFFPYSKFSLLSQFWIGSVIGFFFFGAPFFPNCLWPVSKCTSHSPDVWNKYSLCVNWAGGLCSASSPFCLPKDKEIPCASLDSILLLFLIPHWLSRFQRKPRFSSGMEGKTVTFSSQFFVERI